MRSPPLAGLRVLDLTRLLPGPLASMHLADLGADVIKIEDTGAGDYARSAGAVHGNISYFQLVNRNKRSFAAWTALFERVDCCVTPVLRFEESLQNEQFQARGMIVEVAGFKQFAPPYQISELPFEARLPPPAAGEHSEEILRENGFSADEIAGLRAQKVI